jgi:hypothetical protein
MPTKQTPTPTDRAKRAEAKRRKLRAHTMAQVAEYLRENGFEHPERLKTTNGYQFDIEDLTVFAGVQADGRDLVFLVGTEVMALPSDADLVVPLMRELLEINARARGPARIAIDGDSVWVVVVDLADLMPDADFGRSIDAVLAWAEQLQKSLPRKYHRTTRKRR